MRGLRTSRKGRPYNRAGRYKRSTKTSSRLDLRLMHNIICHLLIFCLLLRLIKHSLLLHPIISLKCPRIPGIVMRLWQINHLGGVIHL
jgi:hypothetical protein